MSQHFERSDDFKPRIMLKMCTMFVLQIIKKNIIHHYYLIGMRTFRIMEEHIFVDIWTSTHTPCCKLYLHVIHYIATIVDSRTCSHSYTNIPFLHVFLNVNYFCQFIYSMATVKIFFTWITVKLSSVIYRVINFMRQLIILVVSIGIACLLQVVVFFIRIITCWSIINLLCYPVKLLF